MTDNPGTKFAIELGFDRFSHSFVVEGRRAIETRAFCERPKQIGARDGADEHVRTHDWHPLDPFRFHEEHDFF